jgi:hypothetical protein
MSHNSEPRQPHSPLAILTELAVEGASSFIEAQRIFLNLAQQENDLLMNGVKERVGDSTPAAAMTDLMRRSLDTLIDMQQEFLTLTSKQTLQWLDAVQSGKGYQNAHLVDLAREGMKKFVHAHQKLLDALTEETIKATSGKSDHPRPVKKTEVAELAREAADLFVDAQKKVLDVAGQQMSTNLKAATQAAETLSPARLASVTELPMKAVRSFFEGEKALLQSLVEKGKRPKAFGNGGRPRKRVVRHRNTAVHAGA